MKTKKVTCYNCGRVDRPAFMQEINDRRGEDGFVYLCSRHCQETFRNQF